MQERHFLNYPTAREFNFFSVFSFCPFPIYPSGGMEDFQKMSSACSQEDSQVLLRFGESTMPWLSHRPVCPLPAPQQLCSLCCSWNMLQVLWPFLTRHPPRAWTHLCAQVHDCNCLSPINTTKGHNPTKGLLQSSFKSA